MSSFGSVLVNDLRACEAGVPTQDQKVPNRWIDALEVDKPGGCGSGVNGLLTHQLLPLHRRPKLNLTHSLTFAERISPS